jgi:hypothetical protein
MMTVWSKVLEKLKFGWIVTEFAVFYATQGFNTSSVELSTGPYSEPDEYSLHPFI